MKFGVWANFANKRRARAKRIHLAILLVACLKIFLEKCEVMLKTAFYDSLSYAVTKPIGIIFIGSKA